ARPSVTPLFLLGTAATLVGAYIRAACYRELGTFFTFSLTIRDNHKLVTTGPYTLVRHPSYTGIVLLNIGMTLCIFGPGSWFAQAGADTALGKCMVLYWIWQSGVLIMAVRRAPSEDEMLHRQFGGEWEEYARKVPHMFIPHLL
ncbi:hypothetical protein K488DRAFT_57882, partial [Vararia minispora EC-137]